MGQINHWSFCTRLLTSSARRPMEEFQLVVTVFSISFMLAWPSYIINVQLIFLAMTRIKQPNLPLYWNARVGLRMSWYAWRASFAAAAWIGHYHSVQPFGSSRVRLWWPTVQAECSRSWKNVLVFHIAWSPEGYTHQLIRIGRFSSLSLCLFTCQSKRSSNSLGENRCIIKGLQRAAC